jgi:hypothetical protein
MKGNGPKGSTKKKMMIKSSKMTWDGNVARMDKRSSA